MAVTLVQTAAIGSTAAGTSQQTGAFAANPTVGNYLVAWAWGWGSNTHNQTPAFSDTAGNTWTVPANSLQQIAVDVWCHVGYCKVASTGATFKVTSNSPCAAGGGSIMVVAAEFSGVAAAAPLDGAAVGTTGTTGVPAPGSLTLTSGDLVVGPMSSDQTTYTSFGYSTPTGFSRAGFQNDGSTFQVGEAVYAINHASPSAPTWKTGTVKWVAAQFALLAASSSTSTSFGFSPTLADVALASGFAAASPPSSALTFAPTVANVALTSSFTAAAGGNSLLTSLSAYWKLDEASGNAVDALGSNDLTNNGACGTASGVVSTARTFDGSTQSLSHATNSTFAVGDIDVTFAAWVYLTDKTAVRTILSRRDSDAAAIQYVLRYVNTSDRFTFFVSSDGTAGATGGVSANNFGSPSLSTWYHVVAWHDSVNNQVGISVNAGAPNLVSYSAGIFDTTASFRVGATGIGENWAGRLDEVAFYKRVLTSADRDALYNGGSGFAYPFDAASATFVVSATLAPVALSASLTSTAPASSSATLAPTLAGVALASTFTASAAGVSSITLAPTLAAATLSATLTSTAPAASSFSAAATLTGVTLAASLTSTAPGSSSITLAPTLAAVALTSIFTATAPGSSSITVAPTLAAVALSSSFTTVAPSSSSFSASATLANVALASSFSANTVGSCSFSTAPTLAPVALSSTLATTTPAASSFSAAASLAAVTLASTFTASASGATSFAVAGTIPTTLAATLATTQPAASALTYAANLANVAFSALLTASGPPGPASMALAATLANCTANLHLIASGGVVTAGRHPDAGRSTGVRLGPDPSRSQGRRLGPDPSRSTGSVT